MPDWDEDSPRLRENLVRILRQILDEAGQRVLPDLDTARSWQRESLAGLEVPEPEMTGGFRGEQGLEGLEVRIGQHRGVPSANVIVELTKFQTRLHAVL